MRNLRLVRGAVLAAAVVALALSAGGAKASIIGDTVHVDRLMPDTATVAANLGNAVVGAGIEYPASLVTSVLQNIDFAANTVTITEDASIATSSFFFAETFNGFGLSDLTHSFTSVSIDPLTNLAGLTASDLSLSNGEIFLNLSGLRILAAGNSFGLPATNLVLDLDTASVAAIPEPASLALFVGGLGLLGLGLKAQRRTRRGGASSRCC